MSRNLWLGVLVSCTLSCQATADRGPALAQVSSSYDLTRDERKSLELEAAALQGAGLTTPAQVEALKSRIGLLRIARRITIKAGKGEPTLDLLDALADAEAAGVSEGDLVAIVRRASPARAGRAVDRMTGLILAGVEAAVATSLAVEEAEAAS